MKFRHDRDQHCYEAVIDGRIAGFAQYQIRDNRHVFTHTEVDPALEGKGIGSRLVRFALDDMAAADAVVVPQCLFIASYIERHPEYRDLVTNRKLDDSDQPHH